VPIDSPQFGRVMAVCIGAMMVGSIATTVSEGDFVKRGQEFGYFAFGPYYFYLRVETTTPSINTLLCGAGRWLDDCVSV
jgi:phosphatidylserine decarboxylase